MQYPLDIQLAILFGIVILTAIRLFYIKGRPVLRDVHVAQIPFSKRLKASDFFRRPKSFEIRQTFDVLPYGVIWFAINLPIMHLTRFGEKRWSYALAIIDMIFIWVSFELGIVSGLIYASLTTFHLLKAPWNVSISWLIVCGVFSWIFLILAPAAKLPVGIPMRQAKRVQGLLFHQHNYVYYSLLGLLWLFVFWRTVIPWFLAGTWLAQVAALGI